MWQVSTEASSVLRALPLRNCSHFDCAVNIADAFFVISLSDSAWLDCAEAAENTERAACWWVLEGSHEFSECTTAGESERKAEHCSCEPSTKCFLCKCSARRSLLLISIYQAWKCCWHCSWAVVMTSLSLILITFTSWWGTVFPAFLSVCLFLNRTA